MKLRNVLRSYWFLNLFIYYNKIIDENDVSVTNKNGATIIWSFGEDLYTLLLSGPQVFLWPLKWRTQFENHSVLCHCPQMRVWNSEVNQQNSNRVQLSDWQFFGYLVSIYKFPAWFSHFLSTRSVRMALWGTFYCWNLNLGHNFPANILSNCGIDVTMKVLQWHSKV